MRVYLFSGDSPPKKTIRRGTCPLNQPFEPTPFKEHIQQNPTPFKGYPKTELFRPAPGASGRRRASARAAHGAGPPSRGATCCCSVPVAATEIRVHVRLETSHHGISIKAQRKQLANLLRWVLNDRVWVLGMNLGIPFKETTGCSRAFLPSKGLVCKGPLKEMNLGIVRLGNEPERDSRIKETIGTSKNSVEQARGPVCKSSMSCMEDCLDLDESP